MPMAVRKYDVMYRGVKEMECFTCLLDITCDFVLSANMVQKLQNFVKLTKYTYIFTGVFHVACL